MPFRNNVYHDPAIAKGFSNIASAFAPPSGADLYGFAKAGQTRDEMARKAAALASINSGKGTLGDYIAAGVANPVTSYGRAGMLTRANSDPSLPPSAFDTGAFILNGNANNTFEGQGRKLAVDSANNVRDNNAKVVVAGMTPVARDATRYVPPAAVPVLGYDQQPQPTSDQPSISSLFGPSAPGVIAPAASTAPDAGAPAASAAPGAGMTQMGAMFVKPGERAALPNGQALEGTDKPQSVDQVRAQAIAAMAPDDPIRKAIIAGDIKTQNVLGPNGQPQVATTPQAIGAAPAPKETTPSPLFKLEQERDALRAANPNDPKIRDYNDQIKALNRGQQQDKYSQVNDEDLAKLNNDIFTRAQTAASNQASLNKLQQLVQEGSTDQGKWASTRVEVRKAMNSLGLNGGDTSPMEVMSALGNKLALELRNPAQGAGMPGSLSDSDRNFLASMVANPDHSFQANMKLLDIYSKMNQRAIDYENMRRAYVGDKSGPGRIDENFRNKLSDFAIKNPIFGDGPAPQPAPAAGATPQAAAAPATPDASAQPDTSATPAATAATAAPKRLKYNPATGEIE